MSSKLLIVEDDKYLAEDIQNILDLYDYESEIINEVDELLVKKSFGEYSAIFLDVMMRTDGRIDMTDCQESGEAAYKYIRRIDKGISIIVMSAMDEEDIQINFDDANVKYIKKPFSGIDQLLELIE